MRVGGCYRFDLREDHNAVAPGAELQQQSIQDLELARSGHDAFVRSEIAWGEFCLVLWQVKVFG